MEIHQFQCGERFLKNALRISVRLSFRLHSAHTGYDFKSTSIFGAPILSIEHSSISFILFEFGSLSCTMNTAAKKEQKTKL